MADEPTIEEALKTLKEARELVASGQLLSNRIPLGKSFLKAAATIEKNIQRSPAQTHHETARTHGTRGDSPTDQPVGMKISDFFEDIGAGVVAAQEHLDNQTRAYLENRSDLSVPSLFRIPKASAEIHFSIEEQTSKGFNVMVFKSSDSRQQQQQHKVSFDIVAVPPPPELLQQLGTPKAREVFVLGPRERQEIRDRAGSPAAELLTDAVFPRVLILRGEDAHLLLLPNPGSARGTYSLASARVPVAEGGVTTYSKSGKTVAAAYNSLLEVLLALSEDQRRRLGHG